MTLADATGPQDVLTFWFDELTPGDWFRKSRTLDRRINSGFRPLYDAACQGETWRWRETPRGRLAEIIVLDQFSRNIFRDQALAFAQDTVALVLAQEAVAQGADQALTPGPERAFLYMPYMHSESPLIQQTSLALFEQPGLEANLKFARQHKDIVDRFGRYPHRNAVLGRVSTPEEEAFLKEPGSSF